MIENRAGQPVDVEAKANATVKMRDLSGLKKFASLTADQFTAGVLLYDGDETPLGSNLWAAPLSTLWDSQSRHQRANMAERKKYHDSTHPPLMVSLLFVLQRAENATKNTIDDVDCVINSIVLFLIFQNVINSSHSHSIINKPFLSIIFNSLFSC